MLHGRPTARVPFVNHLLRLLGQGVEDAVFDPSRTNRVDRDSTRGEGDREIPAKRFHRNFCRTHGHPGLPASGAATGSIRDGDNPAAFFHQSDGFANSDQECFCLGIHGSVPLVQSDVHGTAVKRGHFGASIADENVQIAKLGFYFSKHALDFLRLTDIRLHHKSVGTFFANFGEGVFRGGFIFNVVDGDLYFLLGELQSDASANAPRTPGNQGAFA